MASLTVLRKRLSELLAGPEYALGEVQVDARGMIVWGLSSGDKKFRPIDVDSNGRVTALTTPVLSLNAEVASRFMSLGQAVTAGHLTLALVAGEGAVAVASTHNVVYTAHSTTENTALQVTLIPAAGTIIVVHAIRLTPPDDAGVETHTVSAGLAASNLVLLNSLISTVNGTAETMDAERGVAARTAIIAPFMAIRWTTSAAVVAASVGTLYGLVEVIT